MKKAKLTKKVIYLLWFLVSLLWCLSLSPARSQQFPTKSKIANSPNSKFDHTIQKAVNNQIRLTFDSIRINKFIRTYVAFKPYAVKIHTFYRHRQYAYAWFEHGKLIEQASNLVNRVLNLELEGLNKHAPYERQLDSLMFTENTTADLELELMLTAQYFVFAKLAWTGQDLAFSRAADWNLPRKKIDYEQYLDTLISMKVTNSDQKAPV